MARFASHPVRKVLGTLTTAAQTLSLELDNVVGRRIAAIGVQLVITNGVSAPVYNTTAASLDSTYSNFADLISEMRVLASDYARPSQTPIRQMSGKDMLLWGIEQGQGLDPDTAALICNTGAAATTYRPTLWCHFAHPNLEDPVGNRGCLPLNVQTGADAEGAAFVREKVKIELDVRGLDVASTPTATQVYSGASSAIAPSSVTVVLWILERYIPSDYPYIATEQVVVPVTSAGWTAGGSKPEPYKFASNGWLIDFLMQWYVSGARSNDIFPDVNGFMEFRLGDTQTLESWDLYQLRAHNSRGMVRQPARLASENTLRLLNPPPGAVMRDLLFSDPNAYAYQASGVRSLYTANNGELPQLAPTALVASTTLRLIPHKVYIKDITKLVSP